MKAKLIIAIGVIAVVAAAAAGGAMWYTSHDAAAGVAAKPAPETKLTKYVTLDKVIVMLRRAPAEQSTHYLSVDLVLATTAEDEKAAKEHLPLLRSIAVSALSARTMAEASAMTVDGYATELNKVFDANYAKQNHIKPFSEVMVGKLIIE
jgi:flagellar FliL protein